MNKQELVEYVQKAAGIETKVAATAAVNAVLDGISEGIKKGGPVQLIGFGAFSVKERAARQGRNPLTGEKIKIKATKVVSFKVGAELKATAKKSKAAKK